jgi:integrase
MITEAAIRAMLKSAPTSGKKSIEMRGTHGDQKGAGRLVLVARVRPERVIAEWYAHWFRDGKKGTTKLGTYPALSLADAREKFRKDYAPAIASGANPTGPRARRDKTGITVTDLFKAYVADLARVGAASARDVSRVLLGSKGDGGVAEALGRTRRANAIGRDDIIPILREINTRGRRAMAAATRGYIGAAYAFAIKSGGSYLSEGSNTDWGITVNPVSAIDSDSKAKKPGQRYLLPSEFRAFWKWAETRDTVSQATPAARILMATGQRISEIMAITDESYDRVESIVDWAKTKNGLAHSIPLPRQAAEILDDWPTNAHGLFFPSRMDAKQPMKADTVVAQIEAYVKATGARSFVARDIRRTWKTLGGQAGITRENRDAIQNHAQQGVGSKHYDRWNYMREKRAAMAVWEAFLDRMLAGEFDDNAAHARTALS